MCSVCGHLDCFLFLCRHRLGCLRARNDCLYPSLHSLVCRVCLFCSNIDVFLSMLLICRLRCLNPLVLLSMEARLLIRLRLQSLRMIFVIESDFAFLNLLTGWNPSHRHSCLLRLILNLRSLLGSTVQGVHMDITLDRLPVMNTSILVELRVTDSAQVSFIQFCCWGFQTHHPTFSLGRFFYLVCSEVEIYLKIGPWPQLCFCWAYILDSGFGYKNSETIYFQRTYLLHSLSLLLLYFEDSVILNRGSCVLISLRTNPSLGFLGPHIIQANNLIHHYSALLVYHFLIYQ